MSTIVNGQEIDIFEILPPLEGSINIYYGRIGAGKTLAGTKNIYNELKDGIVCYANWDIDWQGYDEKESKWKLFLGLIKLKKNYFKYPKENFHFWNFVTQEIDNKPYQQYFNDYSKEYEFTDVLSKLTDCSVHLDEGHIPFDSYEATRMSEAKRSAVFAMRHFDRSLTVYTQRANSVHVNLRGNTNRFYKCEKTIDFTIPIWKKRIQYFTITEFQDLTSSNTVDETREKDKDGNETGKYLHAVSVRSYFGTKKLFSRFNSKYLRTDAEHSQPNNAWYETLEWNEIRKLILKRKPNSVESTPPTKND